MGTTKKFFTSLGILAVATFGLANLALGAQDPKQDLWKPTASQWSDTFIIDARPHAPGVSLTGGEYFATFEGRRFQLKEAQLNAYIGNSLTLYYGKQDFHLEGRSQSSRFNLYADTYGGKYILHTPDEDNDYALAIEAQFVRPGDADGRSGNSQEVFAATQDYAFAVDCGTSKGPQAQLGYAYVKTRSHLWGSVYSAGIGQDTRWPGRAQVRLQGHLSFQKYSDAVESKSFEPKISLYAGIGYDSAKHLRFEADGSLFPIGIPLASGRYTGLSSFELYRPPGVAGEIRNKVVGFGAIRAVLHWEL